MLESFFNKAAGLQACSFIKKRLQHRCFPANISKILITAFFINTSGGCLWQLLYGQLYFCLNKDHVVVVFSSTHLALNLVAVILPTLKPILLRQVLVYHIGCLNKVLKNRRWRLIMPYF